MGTVDHNLHRVRRTALNLFFSRGSVVELMPHLKPVMENLAMRLDNAAVRNETVNLKYAYNSVTMDNMTEYCFSRRGNRVLLPDFDKDMLDRVEDSHHSSQLVSASLTYRSNEINLTYLEHASSQNTWTPTQDTCKTHFCVYCVVYLIKSGIGQSLSQTQCR